MMADRLGDRLPFFSLHESLYLGWFICFAIFGLAYYTNPSEKSFKSFLDKFQIPTPRSPPKIDVHLNRSDHTINRNRGKTHQQQPLKPNSAYRNSKNSSQPLSASSQVSFPPPSTSAYNKHNLLLCTLISVDRTQHLSLNISFDHPVDDSYPQLEWFLGCFDTWFTLRRQILPAFALFPVFWTHQTLKTIWNQWKWPIPDLLLPQKLSNGTSLQDSSPLNKPKRKKSHRTSKVPSLQCQTSDLSGHSAECSTPEHSISSSMSGREPDRHPAPKSSPNLESGPLLTSANVPSVSVPTQNGKPPASHIAPTSLNSALPISATSQVSESIAVPNDVVCGSHAISDLESSSDCSIKRHNFPASCDPCPPLHSRNIESKSCTPSERRQQAHGIDLRSSPVEIEHKVKEPKAKQNQDRSDKPNCPSSSKHLNDAKELKSSKQLNLNEKQDGPKSSQASSTKQPTKAKTDSVSSHRTCASINTKSKKDPQQIKKEEERSKISIRPNKLETGKISKAKDTKDIKKIESKEKLAARQAESARKREVNFKPTKPSGNVVVTHMVDRQSPVQDSEIRQPARAPHHSFGSSASPPSPDQPADIPINLLHSNPMIPIPSISQPPNLMMPFQPENFNSSLLPLDVLSQYPPSDPWAQDLWSETVQQTHIRDSFISLPNLERSALKDHYILRGLDHASPLHSISPSPLSEEVLNYQQVLNLPPRITSSPEWALPPPIQTSPFGAIGQQGPGTPAPAHSSPVSSSSLFRFPGPSTHPSHLIENAFLVRPNSARKEEISRTSSSTSLSQLPAYCSTRTSPSLSPYAPIGTPLYPRQSGLDEVCERPGEVLSGVNMAYPRNCGTRDLFDGRAQDANIPEPGLGYCAALSLHGTSQISMPFDTAVSSSAHNPVEGYTPINSMQRPSSSVSGHHTTQSLNVLPQPATNAFNSIFVGGPEKSLPTLNSSTNPKRSGLGLNPSAKVFAFGGSKTSSGHNSCPPAFSVDRQRARGYSQSIIPTFSESVHKPINYSNLLSKDQQKEDKSKNLLKSLHRSSWSVFLDFKGIISSSHDFKPETAEISNLRYDELRPNSGSRTGFLSQLASHSSTEDVLPAVRSKSASAGLFGSIGDMKAKKTSASSSTSVSPSVPCSVLEQPFSSSP